MSGSGQCAGRLVFWLTMSAALTSVAAASTSIMRRSDRLLDKQQQIRPSSSDWDTVGQPARRITPKSVFVAPALSGCSDGYRQDGLGRCVKLVKVNQAAQLDFLLQKLNSKFASPLGDAGKPGKPEPDAGPFRVSIPIGSDAPRETTTTTTVATTTDAFVDEDDISTETTTRPQNSSVTKVVRYPHSSSTAGPTTLSTSNFAPHRRRQPPSEDAGKPFVIVVADTTQAPTTTLPTMTSLGDRYEDHTHFEATPLPETFTTFASETTTSPSPPSTIIPTTNMDTEETTSAYTYRPFRKPFPDVTPITWLETTTQVPTTFLNSETVPGSTEYFTQPPATSGELHTDTTVNTTPLDLQSAVQDGNVDEDRFSTTSSVLATGNSDTQQLIVLNGDDVTEGVLEDPFRAATEPPEDYQSTDCTNWPATQQDNGCRPMRVVTTSSSSYFIRFPTDSVPFRPPVSYSALDDNRPKNGFIRFPGISPPRRTPSQTSSTNYGANRPWNNDASNGDGVSMASSSSVFASWFPFLQQQPSRHWIDRYNNNNNNYQKQQHHFGDYYGGSDGIEFHRKQNRYHRRPVESTSSHVLPAWYDKHIVSWPQSSD